MNRNLKAAAKALGLSEPQLRAKLRALKILNHAGELIPGQRLAGRLFTEERARWNPSINGYSHYGVVMATEQGITWLREQLAGTTGTPNKGAAA